MTSKRRRHVDPGSRVADDVMSNVPILEVEARPRVAADIKDQILKGSIWAGKSCEQEPESSNGEESLDSSEAQHDKKQKDNKDKKTKRGRALLRQPTDSTAVPLFSHPIHPTLIKEFVVSLEATWAIFGTPESGCGLLGCLSPQARIPVVAFARNKTHAETLKGLVKTAIANHCLLLGTEWTSKSLAEQWAQLETDSDSSDSGSCSNEDEDDLPSEGGGKPEEAVGEESKGKHKKKGSKEKSKDKGKTIKQKKKKKKKEPKEGKGKKAEQGEKGDKKKEPKEKNDKKDVKKAGKQDKAGNTGSSSSILDALLKMSGTPPAKPPTK